VSSSKKIPPVIRRVALGVEPVQVQVAGPAHPIL